MMYVVFYTVYNEFGNELNENQSLRPLVDNATVHAHKLRRQAEFLDNMIAGQSSLWFR